MKVLIIEDDILLAKQYERQFARHGIPTRLVAHVIDAIEQIDAWRPDVIVLDMLLVGATALTLLHEVQSHDDIASIPVVLVTNLADMMTLEQLEPYGVVRLLDKLTMQPDDLVTAVRGAVREE